MFVEASVYQVKRVPVEERWERYGLLVLVMRQWPRGVKRSLIDVWIKDAGPSLETLSALRQGLLSPEEFERRYEAELLSQRRCTIKSYERRSDEFDERIVGEYTCMCSPMEHLQHLERLHGKVTILCWELKPPCHRFFLLRWLTGQEHSLCQKGMM